MQKLGILTGGTLLKKCNWKTGQVSAGWTFPRNRLSIKVSGIAERRELGWGKKEIGKVSLNKHFVFC